MANTKSAKKAARQAVRRTEVNKSRTSRARTAVRTVEEAIAAGKKDEADEGSQGRSSRARSQRAEGRAAQEDGEPQSFASQRARQSDVELRSRIASRAPKPSAVSSQQR